MGSKMDVEGVGEAFPEIDSGVVVNVPALP